MELVIEANIIRARAASIHLPLFNHPITVSLDCETSAHRALNARYSRLRFRCRLRSRNSSGNDMVT